MPEETLFGSESRMNRAEIAEYLRTVADRLDSGGRLELSSGEQSVSVDVPDSSEFEVKVEREYSADGGPGELSLELELEWSENGGSSDESSLSIE